MHLVDRDWRGQRMPALTRVHPHRVGPFALRKSGHDRCCCWRELVLKADRICLQHRRTAILAEDLELVAGAAPDAGNEDLPSADLDALAHRMTTAIPVIEVTDDA